MSCEPPPSTGPRYASLGARPGPRKIAPAGGRREDAMLRRDIFRAGLAGAAGLFGLRRASAAAAGQRLKVAYHLSDADKVSLVLGNIKTHYEGPGGDVAQSR